MRPLSAPAGAAPESNVSTFERLLIDSLPWGLFAMDLEGRCILANSTGATLLGIDTPAALMGSVDLESLVAAKRGALQLTKASLKDTTGQVVGLICILTELSESQDDWDESAAVGNKPSPGQRPRRAELEQSLDRERSLLRTIIDSIPAKIYAKDTQSRFIVCNVPVAREMGATPEQLMGRTDFDFFPRSMAEGFYADEQKVISSGRPLLEREEEVLDQISGTIRLISTSKVPYFDAQGRVAGIVGIGWDITERKRADERVRYLASHDSLTGLQNRGAFSETLQSVIQAARQQGGRFAILFVDLDRFKFINDTLGHEAGDALLKQTADRLRQCVRPGDTVARMGGDEFVLLCRDARDTDNIGRLASRVLEAITPPFHLLGQECRVGASIGTALYPMDGDNERALMKNADTAMYTAKQEGRNNYRRYTAGLKSDSLERAMFENGLRRAIESHELLMHYLPKFDLHTGTITGAEALLRWSNPHLGLIQPARFLPVAEEIGLTIPIGVWVLNTVCEQQMAWQREGLPPMCISVNLTARQFADEDLVKHVLGALDRSGMAPNMLELELSEPVLLRDGEYTRRALDALKQAGVRVAIDNFGASYLSLSSIRRFPIDTLKVDRALLRDIEQPEARAIADAIITVAKSLSVTVIAEGVETIGQAAFAREHACDAMQGFYVSEPAAATEFAALLRKQHHASGRR